MQLPLKLPQCKDMQPRANFRITPFTNKSGSESFRVTGTAPDGKRIRENFQTREEATGRRQELEIEGMNQKPEARLKQTKLSPEQIIDAEHAFSEIGTAEFTLVQAVKFYCENYRPPQVEVSLADAVSEFLRVKEAERARSETINNLRFRLNPFVNFQPKGKLTCNVVSDDIESFLDRDEGKPRGLRSKKNDHLALSNFFNWCVERKPSYCAATPIPKRKFKFDEAEPVIMPIGTVRRLMAVVAEYKDGLCVPYFALALFAGIRPNELRRLTWKHIDLKDGIVTIGASAAKTRSKRHVEFCRVEDQESNLLTWLLPYVVRKTPIAIGRFDFEKVKALANLNKWTPDILRHTAASHHLALLQHEGKTAAWLGNSPDIVQRHYRNLVKRKEAEEFWGIRPIDASRKIISMP